MTHKQNYDSLKLKLEMIHSRKTPYIQRSELVPIGNGNTSFWSEPNGHETKRLGGINASFKSTKSPKLPSAASLSPTGFGDIGMETSFEVAPVGDRPVISKGMPVGFPKRSFAEFIQKTL